MTPPTPRWPTSRSFCVIPCRRPLRRGPCPRGRCGSRSRSGSTRTGTRSRSDCPSATSCSAASPEPASRSPSRSSSPPPPSTPSVTLTLLDGKQVELAPWSGSAEHFVGPDMAGAIDVLKDLCAEMDRRYAVLLSSGLRKIEPGWRLRAPRRRHRRARLLHARRDQGRAQRALRDAARPDLEGTGGRHDRHRRHPEALQRHRPDLRPGPLLVPHGAALHHARGLRHHPRTGLGQGGLLGLDPRPDQPRRRVPAGRGCGPGQDPHALPRRRLPSPSWRSWRPRRRAQ